MAGTAPTDLQFTKTLDAVPVHCSVWLVGTPGGRYPPAFVAAPTSSRSEIIWERNW
jgi:hypothetical protein